MVVDTVYMANRTPLDERLVQITLDLLRDEGLEGLTLRRIARRAGVSHGAPLRHFRSLADLLSEVAAVGFRMLSEGVEKSGSQLPPNAGPRARLRAAGRAYVEIAVANPGLFGLMFRPEDLDVENKRFLEAAFGSFEQFVEHVAAAQDEGWNPERDTRVLAASVWASVHGLATLWAQGAVPVPHATLEALLVTTLDFCIGGDFP